MYKYSRVGGERKRLQSYGGRSRHDNNSVFIFCVFIYNYRTKCQTTETNIAGTVSLDFSFLYCREIFTVLKSDNEDSLRTLSWSENVELNGNWELVKKKSIDSSLKIRIIYIAYFSRRSESDIFKWTSRLISILREKLQIKFCSKEINNLLMVQIYNCFGEFKKIRHALWYENACNFIYQHFNC